MTEEIPLETDTETPTPTETVTETPTETSVVMPGDTETPTPTEMATETATETTAVTETPTQASTGTTTPVNGLARYYYVGNGTMVKSVIGEIVTYYPSSAYQVKTDGTNLNTRKYYAFGSTTVAMRENDEITWLLTDQVNSTTVTASEDGTLVSEIKYTAFGEVRSLNGVLVTENRYIGPPEDSNDVRSGSNAEGKFALQHGVYP